MAEWKHIVVNAVRCDLCETIAVSFDKSWRSCSCRNVSIRGGNYFLGRTGDAFEKNAEEDTYTDLTMVMVTNNTIVFLNECDGRAANFLNECDGRAAKRPYVPQEAASDNDDEVLIPRRSSVSSASERPPEDRLHDGGRKDSVANRVEE